jgi:hypothetical protein
VDGEHGGPGRSPSAIARAMWMLAAVLVLAAATAASARPLRRPVLYLVHGYLEPAPKSAEIVDRVDITARGKPTRWLLVTSYRAPGPVSLGGYLSRSLRHPWSVSGKRADVDRLLDAPPGTEVEAKFVIYPGGPATLMIAELRVGPKQDQGR